MLDFQRLPDIPVYHNPIDLNIVLLISYVRKVSQSFYQYASYSCFSREQVCGQNLNRQDINQFSTTIPRIKSDRVFPEIHTLRIKEIKHLFDHRDKTGGSEAFSFHNLLF